MKISKARSRRPKKLTPRERRFFKALFAGKTQADAAREAGYSEKYAKQSGSRAFNQIQEKAPGLFERHGLTTDVFVDQCILPALKATETDARLVGSGTKKKPYRWIYSKPRRDNGACNTANRLVAEMMGLIVKEQEIPNAGIKVVVIDGSIRPKRPAIDVTQSLPPGLGEPKG